LQLGVPLDGVTLRGRPSLKRPYHTRSTARWRGIVIAGTSWDSSGLADTSWNYLCAVRCVARQPTAKEMISTGHFNDEPVLASPSECDRDPAITFSRCATQRNATRRAVHVETTPKCGREWCGEVSVSNRRSRLHDKPFIRHWCSSKRAKQTKMTNSKQQ